MLKNDVKILKRVFKIEADLILKNGMYLDVYGRKFVKGDIAIKDGKIIKVGEDLDIIAKEEKDIEGKFVTPGFIDGHIHLESSVISPEDFAKIASIHGTTAIVTDPHEIANVCGVDGIKYMLQKTKNLPISVYFMVSSCVPASPFDESAYTIDSIDTAKCFDLDEERILGLAEMMNFPGVIFRDSEVMAKIEEAKRRGKRIDGHAPGLSGEDLEKYISAGIESDHECSTINEAMEKIDVARKLGQEFYIMIRQGTAARNLKALVKLLDMPEYMDNVMLCCDDKHPDRLKEKGHIDHTIRKAIGYGAKTENAYVAATYNAAKYFGLKDIGRIEEGATADITVIDDLENVKIDSVYKSGEKMTTEKLANWPKNKVDPELDNEVKNTINMREVTLDDIKCKGVPKQVIGLIPGQIITSDEGVEADYNLKDDIIKLVVIESHKGTMHTGIAYLKGMGLKKGAIRTTVAHDSHYMILAGTNDNDIVKAANELRKSQGGKIYVEDEEVKAKLELPIAGLMTEENPQKVVEKMNDLKQKANVNEKMDAYMNLSFLSLGVIGDIKLLPGGPFNVKEWRFITDEELEKKYKEQKGFEPFDD